MRRGLASAEFKSEVILHKLKMQFESTRHNVLGLLTRLKPDSYIKS
jgi:hypothetical protein